MTGIALGRQFVRTRPLAGVAAAALALALAGCNSTTYGTGVSPGMQTIKDLTGLATGATAQSEPIDYTPRPKIVAPPSVAQLPAPGTVAAEAPPPANWPNDPDAARAKIRAAAAEREANGQELDTSVLPKSVAARANVPPPGDRPLTKEEEEKVRKLFADARGSVAVDENGNPVRRYLSDPPSEYRIPDPTAPLEITDKPKAKKKFKWWWQN